jgi:hypothetical protein
VKDLLESVFLWATYKELINITNIVIGFFSVHTYYALQVTFRLSPVQIVNFLCPIDEISDMRASIEHKKLTI